MAGTMSIEFTAACALPVCPCINIHGDSIMAQLQFALWDGVGGYAEQDENMADVYDEHIRLAQRLEALVWHSYFVIEHQNSPVGRITAPRSF